MYPVVEKSPKIESLDGYFDVRTYVSRDEQALPVWHES